MSFDFALGHSSKNVSLRNRISVNDARCLSGFRIVVPLRLAHRHACSFVAASAFESASAFVRLVCGVVSVVDGIELGDVFRFQFVRCVFIVGCGEKIRVELVPSDLFYRFGDFLSAILASVKSVFGIVCLSYINFVVGIVAKNIDVEFNIGIVCIVVFHS